MGSIRKQAEQPHVKQADEQLSSMISALAPKLPSPGSCPASIHALISLSDELRSGCVNQIKLFFLRNQTRAHSKSWEQQQYRGETGELWVWTVWMTFSVCHPCHGSSIKGSAPLISCPKTNLERETKTIAALAFADSKEEIGVCSLNLSQLAD